MTKPKWLQGMVGPTLVLWLTFIAFGIVWAISSDKGGPPDRADIVSRILFPYVVASWVVSDSRKRGKQLYYDYGSFVYFASFIVGPIYLFQTRGVRAVITLLCFAGLCLLAAVIASVPALAREFRSP